ncbi:MAG TPA: carboxypeptidase-like regulatory domain-containing protein [Pyrinomonadaceae bacterium]|jgi:hypothetical protein
MQRFSTRPLYRSHTAGVCLLVVLLSLSASPGAAGVRSGGPSANDPAGRVDVTVTDQAGASVGAAVGLLTPAGVRVLRADTDARGHFTFEGVAEGSYVLVVENGGFDTRLSFIVENVIARNYRTMGSGIDAPGTNAVVSIARSF